MKLTGSERGYGVRLRADNSGTGFGLCLAVIMLAVFCFAPFTGCSAEPCERQLFAMDTFMQLKVYGKDAEVAVEGAVKIISRLDGLLSATETGSEISAVNLGARAVPVSSETFDIISRALDFSAEAGDCFDITLRPVLRAWGFLGGENRVPQPEELEALLLKVDDSRILLDSDLHTVLLPEGAEAELGALAKGYAGDKAAEYMRSMGISSALLDLGSSTIVAIGEKPDGSAWRVAVRDPNDPSAYAGVIEARNTSISTSGGYERYFEDDAGNKYWHIIDPATGRPAESGVLSVTVLCSEAFYGDGLSTALFVMGADAASEYWRTHGGFEFLMLLEDGSIILTPGADSAFTPSGDWQNAPKRVIEG